MKSYAIITVRIQTCCHPYQLIPSHNHIVICICPIFYLQIFQSNVEFESDIEENHIEATVSNLLRLTSNLNTWTSNFVVTHGDQFIDVSSAAQGLSSFSPPAGAFPPQKIPYPGTKYQFDENIFFGMEAKDSLFQMIKSPKCIDGCKLVFRRPNLRKTLFRQGSWTLVCSHGIVMNELDESKFYPDSVGKFNVPIQNLKRTKSSGSAVKGEYFLKLILKVCYAIFCYLDSQYFPPLFRH